MQYRPLGPTGIDVSRIILGCGNFGGVGSAPEFFGRGETDEEAFRIMDAAWEMGVTTFDTADAYGGGRSETAIGRWLATKGPEVRERLVLATKVFHSVEGDPADRGLARDRILRQIGGSLARLGLERVDLYLIHEPDPETPIEETLGAFDELVRQGKVRAIGGSNVDAEQLTKALDASVHRGLARFEWVQNSFSLLDRAAGDDVLPLCVHEELGFTPYSPLAGGWLTGKYAPRRQYAPGSRMTLRPEPYRHLEDDRVYRGLEDLGRAAGEHGVDMPTLALAWLLSDPGVTAVIVGPRRPEHLEPARAALGLALTRDERDRLAALFPRRDS